MNNNMQDMILKEKIEKREKFDTILAYFLLVILLGCIALVLVLKFTRKEKVDTNPDEYVPNYISLSEISTSFNASNLVNSYTEDGASVKSNVSGNSIVINYTKEDVDFDLDIPMVGNEIMVTIEEEYNDIITDIYEEIACIICVYYGNEERYCKNTLDNMDSDGIEGIRFVNNGDSNSVYITTTESFVVNSEIVYNDVTDVYLTETDYVLNMLDVKVYNVNVITDDSSVKVSGNIDRLTDDTSNVTVNVKLYDVLGNVLVENKYEYNEANVLENTGTFEVVFMLNEDLQLVTIDKYSIEIVK